MVLPLPPLPAADLAHIVERGQRLWPRLRQARLFLTGATGFFGSWLVEALLHANRELGLQLELTALSRNPAAFLAQRPHLQQHAALHWLQGDIGGFAFPVGHWTHLIHGATAASAALNQAAPLTMFDTIVGGTRQVLEFARQAGIADLLFISSGAVYGPQPGDMATLAEDFRGGPDPLAPSQAYAEGKRAGEHLCALYAQCHGLKPRIARCFAFVGPHLPLDTHFAIGNFLRDALAQHPITLQGDGRPLRSYLYAADLVLWLLSILLDGEVCRPYNVGSDQAIPLAELAELCARIAHPTAPPPLQILGQPQPGPAPRYVPDIGRARRELGLAPWTELAVSIRNTLEWQRKIASAG